MKKIILLLAFALSTIAAGAQQYTDSLRILCIGNSFTYVEEAHLKLQALANSQGHYIDLNAQLQGGYTFQRHLRRDETLSAIIYYRYDHVFLQDQSQTPALYAVNPKHCSLIVRDGAELAQRIRIYSPDARIWMEQTWAYSQNDFGGFGSYERFDALLRKGTKAMARAMRADVSPIGEAFRQCRAAHPDIDLYDKDAKHQSAYGSYLKACVNYLILYRTPFTHTADDCGLDPKVCALLREVAEQIVLR